MVAAAVALLTIGTLFLRSVERWSTLDALYFCVIALLTVGLGDVAPVTAAGRAFTIVYLTCGVGLVALAIRTAVRTSIRLTADERAERECPACGRRRSHEREG